MAANGNSGGPWGSGGPKSPWGQSNNQGGGNGGGGDDFDDLVDRLQARFRRFVPGRSGGGRGILWLGLIVVIGWLATGFYTVDPKEQGVELIFGKLITTTASGLHYNFPSPIGDVILPEVTNVNQVEVGFRTASSRTGSLGISNIAEESLMLTGDENIIDVQFVVFWQIKDAADFLFNVRNPENTVKNAAESAMREIVGKNDFEYARTVGRTVLEQQTHALIQDIVNRYGAGIEIVNVNLQRIDPPSIVLDAFRDVQAARADKERAINEANAYFSEITERALGQSEQITQAAAAYEQEVENRAEGDAGRFISILKEYKQSEEITRRRIYLQTMETILQNTNKILIDQDAADGNGIVSYLPLNELIKGNSRVISEGTN